MSERSGRELCKTLKRHDLLESRRGVRQVSEREALIDELMALVDFGQAIQEPYVKLAAERCLQIILKHGGGGLD